MTAFLNGRIRDMAAYVPGEQPKDMARLIKLNTNESPYPPSPATVEALTREVIASARLYNSTDAMALRRDIAAADGVSPENIIVANGSDEILSKLFLGYSDLGARFPDITYGFYRVWSKLYGVSFREIPLMEDYSINPDDYRGHSGMVVFANPNAPT
ncbi:MAG: aminotransferase class I/II-fold pyridoxal phosphate-dependent enzyme, partial [Clostridia bacterium]|nr:aminotransferase class I/II-fold pyridoxal phosphate-dependent enzyme [Clostridia bacterium]